MSDIVIVQLKKIQVRQRMNRNFVTAVKLRQSLLRHSLYIQIPYVK
ncbi:MAG: hypothetical protein LUD57_04490 [Ruminococcus sp.]|nr:hypothetical protein [Ruminococcus sp.]